MDLLTISVPSREAEGGRYTLIALEGEVDATNAQELRRVLEEEIAAEPRNLIVDLSGLNFMDSSALRELLRCNRALDRQGGVLGLVRPQGSVARMLRFTRADQLTPVYDSVEEAAAG